MQSAPIARAADEPAPATAVPAEPAEEAAKPIVVWPTLTPAGDEPSTAALHRPAPTEGAVHARAQELDVTLRDAVQDLGFTLDVADEGPALGKVRDLDMVDRAAHSSARGGPKDLGIWVVSARLELTSGDTFVLRMVAVPPKGKQLRVRVEKVAGTDVSARGLVLLRDLLTARETAPSTARKPEEGSGAGIMSTIRSPGRAMLAVNAALFGAFTAFSIQRASGSEDPRLLYPLLTLGTGIGLGGALLAAEEWDVGTGDAWTLAGGAWWGAASGILVANGRHVMPLTDRYAWGVGGGLIGFSLATFSLTRKKADEGDAVLVHSGAAVGLGLGALGEFFVRGDLYAATPYTGTGYGAAAGLVLAGTAAVFVETEPSRVLLVDLGAGLGAAAGAAAASPLLFDDPNPGKTRGFIGATVGGTLLGGGVAWLLTRDRPRSSALAPPFNRGITPTGGVIGSSVTADGSSPVYGIGLRGPW